MQNLKLKPNLHKIKVKSFRLEIMKNLFKGTGSVISSDSPFKDDDAWSLTRVPKKPLSNSSNQ